MATWPTTLPQCFDAGSYNGQPQDGCIETDMDTGYPQKRRRFTAVYTDHSGTMTMTKDLFTGDFKTFFETTTGFGADSFNFLDPMNQGTTITARFVGSYQVSDFGPLDVKVGLTIRELP